MRSVGIGSQNLKDLTKDHLLEIVMIEGCCNSLDYWNKPIIKNFDNTTFSDTHVLDYVSYRKEDNLKSAEYSFYFDFKGFSFHYSRDYDINRNQQTNGSKASLETIKFLISHGYDVPIY